MSPAKVCRIVGWVGVTGHLVVTGAWAAACCATIALLGVIWTPAPDPLLDKATALFREDARRILHGPRAVPARKPVGIYPGS